MCPCAACLSQGLGCSDKGHPKAVLSEKAMDQSCIPEEARKE